MAIFFSVVIPTYNRAHLIVNTVHSVLLQDHQNFEVLVVDDGSTDNTRSAIMSHFGEESKVRYLYKENGERGAARNYGIKKAEGDYVMFLDSDDEWQPSHLTEIACRINNNPGIKLIAAKYYFKSDNRLIPCDLEGVREGFYGIDIVLKGNAFSCNFGVKKDMDGLVLFQESANLVVIEDWVFLIENLRRNQIYVVDVFTSILHDHPARSMREDNSLIIKRRLYALKWLLNKYKFSRQETKLLRGYSYYFCAIHSYLGLETWKATQYWLRIVLLGIIDKEVALLLLKIILGKRAISYVSSAIYERKNKRRSWATH